MCANSGVRRWVRPACSIKPHKLFRAAVNPAYGNMAKSVPEDDQRSSVSQRTQQTSKRVTQVMKVWIAAAMAGLALATATPAAADDSKYLNLLSGYEFYARLGPALLLQEGHKVCQMISAGTPASDVNLGRAVARDLSVSLLAAGEIVGAAAAGLGC